MEYSFHRNGVVIRNEIRTTRLSSIESQPKKVVFVVVVVALNLGPKQVMNS